MLVFPIAFVPDVIVPEGTPTGRRAFMPDTINTIVPKGTPTKVKPAGRFLPLLQPDESRGSHLPLSLFPSHFIIEEKKSISFSLTFIINEYR